MVPNKLEKEFKNKLEQRTIQPREMAWDRLDAMLSVTEERKKPKKRYWMYIAASFLGFLLVGTLLLKLEQENSPANNENNNAVVNVAEPVKPAETTIPAETITTHEAVAITPAEQQNKDAAKQPKERTTYLKTTLQVNKKVEKVTAVIYEEAVANQQSEVNPVQEADELLASSLENAQPKKKSSLKVDAGSLLSSVEGELDNNFRSEVLQKVVKNYNTVKTSVANRNYQ